MGEEARELVQAVGEQGFDRVRHTRCGSRRRSSRMLRSLVSWTSACLKMYSTSGAGRR